MRVGSGGGEGEEEEGGREVGGRREGQEGGFRCKRREGIRKRDGVKGCGWERRGSGGGEEGGEGDRR